MNLLLHRFIKTGVLCLLGCGWVLLPAYSQEATPEPTAGPLTLSIWLPDLLVLPENTEATIAIEGQIASFMASEPDIHVETRLKRVGDVGGIMATLRAGSAVAPGALPDVTLLRRTDMVAAQRDGLIQSLEGELSSALLSSLDTALKLGQINSTLYGAPYVIELLHVVYRIPNGDTTDYSAWDYESVLNRAVPVAFPTVRATGLNDVVYLQYLAAGGTFSPEGTLAFNRVALLDVLDYYARLRDAGLIDTAMLNYQQFTDYMSLFLEGTINAGVFTSGNYLQMLQTNTRLKAAPIPASQGQVISLMNGWMWVLVADEPEKQALALRFINHMMRAENQLAYARTVNWLPSQRQALLTSLPRSVDSDLYAQLLDNSVLPLTDSEGGTLARAIQDAFADVINGGDPAAAVEAIAAQQGS